MRHKKATTAKRVTIGVLVLSALFVCAASIGKFGTATYRASDVANGLAGVAPTDPSSTSDTSTSALAPNQAEDVASTQVAGTTTAATETPAAIDTIPASDLVASDSVATDTAASISDAAATPVVPAGPVTHLPTPSIVRSAYMTACVASGSSLRNNVVELVDKTALNSIVIDVKDYTGYVSADLGNSSFPYKGARCPVKDMREFLAALGKKGIYRIARIAVMQDPHYAETHPLESVQRKDGKGVWKDKKGLAFVDPGSKEFWKYIRDVAYSAYDLGFDEVNFDYVRFPTDGDLANMSFTKTGSNTKAGMMKQFFQYMGKSMRDRKIPSSVDVFGMVTTAKDDLGIGQVLENVMPNFDFVAPMVYPSHYPKDFNKWKDPNTVPGPLTEFVMNAAVERAKAQGFGASKFRTWIQDFNYGKVYTVADVKAEINGSIKVGVKSYMAWDPANKYTTAAYVE